jgi:hypothetical protein
VSLLIRIFCIPPADFLISLSFGLGCVVRVPPGFVGVVGVVGVLGGVLGSIVVACVDGPPLTVVSGDTVVVAAVAVSITSGGGFLANERRIVICLDRLKLLFKENLQARIASGTDNRGHRNK